MSKTMIQTENAPKAVGIYSQGIKAHGFYFFSGMLGINPQSNELQADFDLQLSQIMKNIDALLEAENLKRENILKTTIFLTKLSNFPKVNEAYERYFSTPYPARSCVEVSALPKNALVEIEVIAG